MKLYQGALLVECPVCRKLIDREWAVQRGPYLTCPREGGRCKPDPSLDPPSEFDGPLLPPGRSIFD